MCEGIGSKRACDLMSWLHRCRILNHEVLVVAYLGSMWCAFYAFSLWKVNSFLKKKQLDIMENWWILWKLWKTKLLLMKNKHTTETWWLSFYFWMQCFPSYISVFSFSMIYSRIMQTGLRIQKDDKIRTTSWKCWL